MRIHRSMAAVLAGLLMTVVTSGCGVRDQEAMAQNGTAVNREADLAGEMGTSGEESGEQTAVSENDAGIVSGNDAVEELPEKPEAVKVKGIYVSGPVAGSSRMDELIQLVDETELNALVIDIKNDEGFVTYKMQSDTVLEIGAGTGYIADVEELVKTCREKDIYLIARIVSFKDPLLAERKPELSVKTAAGEVFRDKSGLAWVNPYRKEVWDYLLEVAEEAAGVGFDEIQFDYIRFSTDLKADQLDFGEEAEEKDKIQIITEFTNYAYEKLSPLGVYVSADVYGTVIDSPVDQKIVGQDYRQMAEALDYICPMIYPSHYGPGAYGLAVPDAKPYDTVYAALTASQKTLGTLEDEGAEQEAPETETAGAEVLQEGSQETETAGTEPSREGTPETQVSGTELPQDGEQGNAAVAKVRPWLQSFTAGWVDGHISYGKKAVRDQIDAVYAAGYDEWILWNAAVKYQKDSLLPAESAQETEQETGPGTEQELQTSASAEELSTEVPTETSSATP